MLALVARHPDPLRPTDVQYTVTMTLAHTPKGLRLVQVEPDYELARVERLRARTHRLRSGGVGSRRPRPVHARVGHDRSG